MIEKPEISLQSFHDFCSKKPPGEAYLPASYSDCAIAQWLKSMGYSRRDFPATSSDQMPDGTPARRYLAVAVNAKRDFNFGALAKRIENKIKASKAGARTP